MTEELEKTDAYGRTVKQIYNELESVFPMPKELGKTEEEANELEGELFFIEDDANELLANIGLSQSMDLSNYPREQLLRIFRYYHLASEKVENGKKQYVDPLPSYTAGNESQDEELYKLGYELGKKGEIGIYYRLLPLIQFRRGYWIGKMERYVDLDDDNILRELSTELKVYDASKFDEEMEYIVNNIFKEEEKEITR